MDLILNQGANFPLSPSYQFYSNGNNLNSDNGTLCGDEVVFIVVILQD